MAKRSAKSPLQKLLNIATHHVRYQHQENRASDLPAEPRQIEKPCRLHTIACVRQGLDFYTLVESQKRPTINETGDLGGFVAVPVDMMLDFLS